MTAPTRARPRVLLLGGTGEARRLACALIDDAGGGSDVLYSLAGRVRDPRVPPSCRVRVGGFGGPDGLAALLRAEPIDILIDATHPFAARISASAATAAALTGRPSLLLRRPGWRERPGDHWLRVPSQPAAVDLVARFVPDRAGPGGVAAGDPPRVFLTTGRGELALFARLDRPWFLIRCVEPPDPALPPRRAVLLDRGPFDVDAERELLRAHRIDVVVTKDSGGSMTAAKLTAARELGLPVVMIDRPPVPAGVDVVDSVEAALHWLAGCTDAG